MNAIHKRIASAVVVSMLFSAPLAYSAEPSSKDSKAAQFRSQEAAMQAESTNMPSASPPVDKNAPAADPIPKATTKAEKKARFAAEEQAMQAESTNMPSASPPVNKSTPAADPIAKAKTKTQKAKRFAAEEKAWQEESTP
jgi:hypothetical protein